MIHLGRAIQIPICLGRGYVDDSCAPRWTIPEMTPGFLAATYLLVHAIFAVERCFFNHPLNTVPDRDNPQV